MRKISREEIDHLLELSKLKLDDKEKEEMQNDFNGIFAFVDQIEKCDISGELKSDKIITLNELRTDEIKPCLSQENVLLCAPKKRSGYFVVPKVVE